MAAASSRMHPLHLYAVFDELQVACCLVLRPLAHNSCKDMVYQDMEAGMIQSPMGLRQHEQVCTAQQYWQGPDSLMRPVWLHSSRY